MSFKYAELTIIKSLDEDSTLNYIYRFLGYESYYFNDTDNFILSFDDGTICDLKDNNFENNKNVKFSPVISFDSKFPLYFELNDITFFYLKPNEDNYGNKKLNYDNIFLNYLKNKQYQSIGSYNNFIYYKIDNDNKKNVFAVIRIKSNEEKPRFILAYDDTYFNKEDVSYLIDNLFKNKLRNEIIKKIK